MIAGHLPIVMDTDITLGCSISRQSVQPQVSFDDAHGGQAASPGEYHMSQNGYWDQNGQWIAEAGPKGGPMEKRGTKKPCGA